ncbi:hypothetical protein B9Z55_007810 [Caenorhabditis nigoni]|uniref:BTB domain-containing protein n=1 Tax=Caenorhabditis nigoni TaxID=1611254 RepID=A0A2G5VBI0_9PELO|nr:hypothetical protein B9Z55_007810 [Caenorhabditis nigoni]
MTEKEFTLKYAFKDVGKLEDYQNLNSSEEKHCGIQWKICIQKRGKNLALFLYTCMPGSREIQADYTMKMFSKNQERTHSKSGREVFTEAGNSTVVFNSSNGKFDDNVIKKHGDPPCVYRGWYKFIDWETLEDEYLDDGKLDVEVHVKIHQMIGFPREELRSFGEDVKQFSDVILVADGRKFYVSRLSLAIQSPYFATLFLGQFQESEQSEIELKDVNPDDLQYYLEVIYAEDAIDVTTVDGILVIANMYITPLVLKKCEQFLMNETKIELKSKLELAGKFRLEELKKVCLNQIQTLDDIRAVVPKNLSDMDHDILADLLGKCLLPQ